MPNTNNSFQNYLDTWEVEEKTNAAYVQGSFEFDELPCPSAARSACAMSIRTRSPRVQPRATQGAGRHVSRRPRSDGGYNKWLPSLNLRFDLTDQLVGRMTAGKVLARPNPSQLALRRSIDIVGLTGSRGNPDLKPYEAKQYDSGSSGISPRWLRIRPVPQGDLRVHRQHRRRRRADGDGVTYNIYHARSTAPTR